MSLYLIHQWDSDDARELRHAETEREPVLRNITSHWANRGYRRILLVGASFARDSIFGESFAHDIADLDNPEPSLLFRWCITGKWKLLLTYDGEVNRSKTTHSRTETRPQLFNLVADPTEQVNLASENPELVAKLVAQIQNWYRVKERKTLTKFE